MEQPKGLRGKQLGGGAGRKRAMEGSLDSGASAHPSSEPHQAGMEANMSDLTFQKKPKSWFFMRHSLICKTDSLVTAHRIEFLTLLFGREGGARLVHHPPQV